MSLICCVFLFIFMLLGTALTGRAITITGYTVTANNRWSSAPTDPVLGPFTPNANASFVGLPYDLSGVGWKSTNTGSWNDLSVTLVSPLHMAQATHVGDRYTNNSFNFQNTDGFLVSRSITGNAVITDCGSTDARLVKLDKPFNPTDKVSFYRLLDTGFTAGAVGRAALVYGHNNDGGSSFQRRIALSNISSLFGTYFQMPKDAATTNAINTYVVGDSGSPTFLIYNGALTFQGTHYSNSSSVVNDANWTDPAVFGGVNAAMAPDGYALRWTIDTTKAYIWTGSNSGNFGDSTNWTSGNLPNSTFSGVLDGATTINRTLNAAAPMTLRGLLIKSSAATNPFSILGSTLTPMESGLRNEDGDTLTINNPITLGGSQNWEAANGPITFGGNIDTAGFLLVLSGEQPLTLNGNITGPGSVAWDNPGTWAPPAGQLGHTGKLFVHRGTVNLTTANSYAGGTVVYGGTLQANNVSGSATGTAGVTVGNSGKLTGTGIISGGVTLQAGAGLTANLSTVPASHDKLEITSVLALGTSSTLTITATAAAIPGTYTLVTAASGITGTLPTLILPLNWSAVAQISGNNLNLVVSSTGPASGTLQFSQSVYTITESAIDGTILTPTFTVTRTGGSLGAISVDYCIWPSEVTNNGVENVNYNILATRKVLTAGTLTWASGDNAPKTFTLSSNSIRSSSTIDGTITFDARIVNVTGGAALGINSLTRLEVLDAQGPTAGVLNFSARRFYGADGSSAIISVRRDGGTTGSVSVSYATNSTLPAVTNNGVTIPAGVAGTNYTTTTGTLTWAAGDSAVKTFTVPLPATGNTGGTMNVALNLSAPTNSSVLGTVPSALLTIQNKASTLYNINDPVEYYTYRVSLPPGTAPVRGVLFVFPGTGGDFRSMTTDPQFRAVADLWRFAIVGINGNSDPVGNEKDNPTFALGRLFDRLNQIANTTGRPEIANAPIAFTGFSAGAFSSSNCMLIWPERTLGAMSQCGWDNLLSSAPIGANHVEVPYLLLPGSSDTTADPDSLMPAHNVYRQRGMTRGSIAMGWGRGHSFTTSASHNAYALYWLDQVMSAGRYLSSQEPSASTAPVLGSIPMTSGWWAARNCTNSATNGYQITGGSSKYLNIGGDPSYTGIKDVNDPLVDCWLPNEAAARAQRGYSSISSITFSTPTVFSNVTLNQATTLTINLNGSAGITKVEYFDGATKLGENSVSPYSFSWTPTAGGLHSITAVASTSSGPQFTAFTLTIAQPAPAPPVIAASQFPITTVGLPFSYQIVASNSPTSYALSSGSLPAGILLNTTTGVLSGTSTTAGTYTPVFTATNAGGTSPAVTVTITVSAPAASAVIINEPFNYTLSVTNPDPDGGGTANSGNGLPATNVGGSPSGTSTGLSGSWGATTKVVASLTYTQGTKILVTSANAAQVTNADWGGQPYVYKSMTTDPFLAQRVDGVNNGNFGVDGTSLYVSLLVSTSSANVDAFRFSFKYDGSANFYLSNTATGWSLNGTAATNAPLAVNTPTLMVLRFDFAAGATDSVRLWVNPPLGVALGTPNATVSNISFPGFSNFQTRSSVANAMTLDEFRLGTSFDAVTPYTEAPTTPAAPSGLVATATTATQITLNWIDNATDETGFKLERSPDGSTGWTQIATPAANIATHTDTSLSAGTNYYYRVRATNVGGDSSYSNIASTITFTGLQAFRTTYGLAANGSQDLLTPANDGVANLLKYAFNMMGRSTGQGEFLTTPNTSVLTPTGSAGLPFFGIDGTGKLTLTYIRRKASSGPGISYAVEFNGPLTNIWATNPSAIEAPPVSLDTTFERVTVTDSQSSSNRFARVKVSALLTNPGNDI